jgi:hypothetical protein
VNCWPSLFRSTSTCRTYTLDDCNVFVLLVEFKLYFDHVKNLGFEDRPDYDYLRKLFRDLLFQKGFSYDYLFDWVATTKDPF